MPTALASASLSLPTLTSLVLLVVGAPLLEELIFRGGLQEALLARVPPTAANLGTAVAFALAHGMTRAWWLAAAVFVPAFALGWLYQRERRIAPCVAAHAAMNLAWLGVCAACGVVATGAEQAA
jgi:membrane protease YdiL (CAAX protease family)